MLRVMRENAGSWIIKILLGIIVIVFIFLGIGPGDTKQENIAVTVNKDVISMDEYRIAYNLLLNMYRNQFGNNLNDELIKMLGLKEKALNNLIEKSLILQEAERLEIDVTQNELVDEITSIKAFQRDGQFSSETYNNYLKYSRQPAEYFEAKNKEDMIVQKVRALITDTVSVAETEAKEWFLWEKASAKIDYVLFDPASYEDITATDEEIQAYYDEHKSQYKSERKVKVAYLNFSPADYKKVASVTDKEIQDYYDANIEKYETEKTVSARHILIKVDENADEAVIENAKVKATGIYQQAIAGKEKFEDLAKKYSEGPSGKNGGDLGTFEHGRMVKPFSDKAFSLAAGEISEPVLTKFGWHIIKVEKVNEAKKQALAEVQEKIKDAILKEKSENLAYDESEDVFTAIVGGAELNEIAESKNLKLVETKFFNNQGPYEVPATIRSNFADTAFSMSANEISDVLEFSGNYYIIQIREIKEPDVQPLDLIKTDIEKAATTAKRDENAKKDATLLLAALKDNSQKISEQKNVKTTGFFTRSNNSEELQLDKKVTDAAFKLSAASPMPAEPVKTGQGYYVIYLKERVQPALADFEKEKERIEKNLLSKKQSKTFDNWLAQLKSSSSIEKNPRLIN